MTYKIHREKGYPHTALISIKLKTDKPDDCAKILKHLLPGRAIVVWDEYAGKVSMEATYNSKYWELSKIKEEVAEIIHEFEQAADFR